MKDDQASPDRAERLARLGAIAPEIPAVMRGDTVLCKGRARGGQASAILARRRKRQQQQNQNGGDQ